MKNFLLLLTLALFMLPGARSFAQSAGDISGRVVNSNGAGLQNVSVLVKGTKNGTVTDADGRFVIHATGKRLTATFSLIGYQSITETLTGNEVTITLPAGGGTQLDTAIVAVGYGYQRRRDVTSAISSVSAAEIKDLPVTNVEEALQGKMAGVQVIKADGSPGGSPTIYIRGITSLNNPSPLYIVDGVRSSGENFNVEDIASVDVLKDASAAAIYGSAAAGGVIIITTKKGSHTKPTFRFGARYGTEHPLVIHMLGTPDFIRLQTLINPNYQSLPANQLPNTDWTNALYSRGTNENYDLSVSGGNDQSNYYISGFYNHMNGPYIDNSNYIAGTRINSDYKINRFIKIGEQVKMDIEHQNPTNENPVPNPPFRSVPTQAIYDSSGNFGKDPAGYGGGNPVGFELTNFIQQQSFNLSSNAYIEIKLPLYLNLRSTISYGDSYGTKNNFQGTYDFGSFGNGTNYLEKSSGYTHTLLDNTVLTFSHTFGKHSILALAGYEQIKQVSDGIDAKETNQAFQPNSSFFRTSQTSLTIYDNNSMYDPNGLIKSEFGRVEYNYDGRYFLMGSVRRDGDFTHFGPANRYAVFPSGSAGWLVSNERFFQGISETVNYLKLRGSYGTVGNANIPSYYFLNNYTTINAQNFSDQGQPTVSQGFTQLSNADIKWETTYETDVAADMEFLGRKLYSTLEYYNKTDKNVLYNVPLPLSSGISNAYKTNIGSINNHGIEITLGYKDKIGALRYDVSVNGTFNRNKVLSLGGTNSNPIMDGSSNLSANYGTLNNYSLSITEPGQPFAMFYGYRAVGMYKTTQQITSNPQFQGQTANLGDLIFQDVYHKGYLNDSDRTIIGNPNPKLVYGINIALAYSSFDLRMTFTGVAGVQIFNATKPYEQLLYGDGNTTTKVFGDSYLGLNGLTGQPRMGVLTNNGGTYSYQLDPNGNYTKPNSSMVENGAYLKLQNLQLGFTVPAKALHLNGVGLRLFVEGSNLFTITKYSGLDPELAGGVTAHGIDAPNAYPHVRTLSGGLNLNF